MPPTNFTSTDPILQVVQRLQDETRRANRIAFAAIGATVGLVAIVGYLVLTERAYLVPPGGPGIARPGMVDDVSAIDYAERWLKERWNFRPKTHKDMQTAILQFAHPDYYPLLKAELEQEARDVRQSSIGTQLVVAGSIITNRRGKVVQVTVTAERTVYLGKIVDREETIQAQLLVVPYVESGRLTGLVIAASPTTPRLTALAP